MIVRSVKRAAKPDPVKGQAAGHPPLLFTEPAVPLGLEPPCSHILVSDNANDGCLPPKLRPRGVKALVSKVK
jgi:hypothetical protein